MLYVTSVIVAIMLRHQERRHQRELSLLYERIGKPAPPRKPKLQKHECWVHLVLGTCLAVIGFGTLASGIAMKDLQTPPGQWEFSGIMLATGITLFILGARSLQENTNYDRMLREQNAV